MSDTIRRFPPRPSLEQLRKQAKELLRHYNSGDSAAQERFGSIIPRLIDSARSADATLSDAQFIIAREHGFESWAKLASHVEAVRSSGRLDQFEQLARHLAVAYATGNPMAIREINWEHGTSFVWDREPEKMQRRLINWFASESRTEDLARADARAIVAHSYGFESWEAFSESVAQPPDDPRSSPLGMSSTPPFYKIDWKENSISLRGPLSIADWD